MLISTLAKLLNPPFRPSFANFTIDHRNYSLRFAGILRWWLSGLCFNGEK